MSSNLLGPLSKDLIRVSIIDPNKGLVGGLTVRQANDYAFSNPGTTFIFEDGNNNIRYLNIAEVNKLTDKDLLRTNECNATPIPCGPPKIKVYGGGGIAAAGNPIISQDGNGSLLAVDVISGGFGYKTTPKADVLDACNIGSGAVLVVELGEIPSYEEYFDEIEEYQIYESDSLKNTQEEEEYDSNGKLIGNFNAQKYFGGNAQSGELIDPIQNQISEYEKLVRSIKNPWWTTRTSQPGSIISGTKTIPQAFAVNIPSDLRTNLAKNNFPVWTDFMDHYAISPSPIKCSCK